MNEFIPPIPFSWLDTMMKALPRKRGKSPCIAICTLQALYYSWKVAEGKEFKLTRKTQRRFGLNHRETHKTLKALEKLGYLKLSWQNGRAVQIRIMKEIPNSIVLSTKYIKERSTVQGG